VEKVFVVGTGMTPFGKSPGRGVRDLATSAANEALADANVQASDVQRIFLGNAVAGVISDQEMIRAEVAFRHSGLAGVPMVNVENACASGSSALLLAWEAIAGGRIDVALVVGAEQLTHADKWRTFAALRGSTDIEEIGPPDRDRRETHSILMDFYAEEAAAYLAASDATIEDYARVAVKNRNNGSRNPLAQYGRPQTIDEVLGSRVIVPPLTLPMCSPVTDGGAALVLCSAAYAGRHIAEDESIEILATEIATGDAPVATAASAAYQSSGLGPEDLDTFELHDAAAPAELIQYAEIGLCEDGAGFQLLRDEVTELGGRWPVNTSGGLMSRGHPLGATGCAQIIEICDQLRGRADGRQVEGARNGMALNCGGWLGGNYAVSIATILAKR
jgi:acetyl-CoA acyltransferase